MGVVDVQIIHQTGFKVLRGAKITPFQKTARQDAKPQLDLIQPGAMDGREVKHRCMRWITQECPPLLPALQGLGDEGESAPSGHQLAHVRLQCVLRLSTTQS